MLNESAMDPQSPLAKSPKPGTPRGWRPRFGLLSLVLVTTVFAVGSAVLGYLLRSGADSSETAVFVILATAAPMGVMIVASLVKAAGEFKATRRGRHRR
jgi:hypothetical protein